MRPAPPHWYTSSSGICIQSQMKRARLALSAFGLTCIDKGKYFYSPAGPQFIKRTKVTLYAASLVNPFGKLVNVQTGRKCQVFRKLTLICGDKWILCACGLYFDISVIPPVILCFLGLQNLLLDVERQEMLKYILS